MTFLNPLDALIPKVPFSCFADFWVSVTPRARGSVSVGFWGDCQLSPLGGGSDRRALSTPPQMTTRVRPNSGGCQSEWPNSLESHVSGNMRLGEERPIPPDQQSVHAPRSDPHISPSVCHPTGLAMPLCRLSQPHLSSTLVQLTHGPHSRASIVGGGVGHILTLDQRGPLHQLQAWALCCAAARKFTAALERAGAQHAEAPASFRS